MVKLLYIKASAQVERSFSVAVANAFVEEYKKKNPQCEVDTLDVFLEKLPEFDAEASSAKYAILHGEPHTERQKQVWDGIVSVINRFKSADKYVFAVPMWNFGIPYRLKQYLDVIVQPGLTFSYDPQKGYTGLVKGKRSIVVYARGGDFSTNKRMDHQQSYFDQILGFMGFENLKSITVEPTLAGGPELAKKKLNDAIKFAQSFAHTF